MPRRRPTKAVGAMQVAGAAWPNAKTTAVIARGPPGTLPVVSLPARSAVMDRFLLRPSHGARPPMAFRGNVLADGTRSLDNDSAAQTASGCWRRADLRPPEDGRPRCVGAPTSEQLQPGAHPVAALAGAPPGCHVPHRRRLAHHGVRTCA